MQNTIIQNVKVLILALLLVVGIGTVYGDWTNPPGSPPTCPSGTPGCDAPLHIGIQGQVRQAGLTVAAGSNPSNPGFLGFSVLNGNVGIGTSAPTSKLEVTSGTISFPAAAPAAGSGYGTFFNYSGKNYLRGDTVIGDQGGGNVAIGKDITDTTIKLDVAGQIKNTDYINSTKGYCINSSCITAWPIAPPAPTLKCIDAKLTPSQNSGNIVMVTGAPSELVNFAKIGTPGPTEVQWGLLCVAANGYHRMGCGIQTASGNGDYDIYYPSTTVGTGCSTDNEEFNNEATLWMTCCKLQ
jgi:hypothetical protein